MQLIIQIKVPYFAQLEGTIHKFVSHNQFVMAQGKVDKKITIFIKRSRLYERREQNFDFFNWCADENLIFLHKVQKKTMQQAASKEAHEQVHYCFNKTVIERVNSFHKCRHSIEV